MNSLLIAAATVALYLVAYNTYEPFAKPLDLECFLEEIIHKGSFFAVLAAFAPKIHCFWAGGASLGQILRGLGCF